jgi:hypothetical protein
MSFNESPVCIKASDEFKMITLIMNIYNVCI